MQHLNGDCEINIPYFLLQILSKMAKAIKKCTKDTTTSLFHCGIINIILTHELKKQNLAWQQFVIHKEFEEPEEMLEEGLKEYEVLMITYIEDETQNSKEKSQNNLREEYEQEAW